MYKWTNGGFNCHTELDSVWISNIVIKNLNSRRARAHLCKEPQSLRKNS